MKQLAPELSDNSEFWGSIEDAWVEPTIDFQERVRGLWKEIRPDKTGDPSRWESMRAIGYWFFGLYISTDLRKIHWIDFVEFVTKLEKLETAVEALKRVMKTEYIFEWLQKPNTAFGSSRCKIFLILDNGLEKILEIVAQLESGTPT